VREDERAAGCYESSTSRWPIPGIGIAGEGTRRFLFEAFRQADGLDKTPPVRRTGLGLTIRATLVRCWWCGLGVCHVECKPGV